MNIKATIAAVVFSGLLIVGVVFLSNGSGGSSVESAQKVYIENGQQIVEITARGGYQPRVSIATSGVPTILRVHTNGTFDCSASIRVPSKGIFKVLPQTGTTDIDLGTTTVGALRGSCGMGMYPFEIDFQQK